MRQYYKVLIQANARDFYEGGYTSSPSAYKRTWPKMYRGMLVFVPQVKAKGHV